MKGDFDVINGGVIMEIEEEVEESRKAIGDLSKTVVYWHDRAKELEKENRELREKIKELEEARTRKFKLPESWAIEE